MAKMISNFIIPFLILALWELLVRLLNVDILFLPPPSLLLETFLDILLTNEFLLHIFNTFLRTLVGFSLSTIIGLILGILLGRFKNSYKLLEPIIDFFRSIPATALFPLFIFASGVGDTSKILVVIYGSSLIVLVNTVFGIRSINQSRIDSMKLYGCNKYEILKYVIIPEAMPSIYSGLKISMSLSIVLIVVTEMFIGTTSGLGYAIIQYQMVYKINEMYCAILMTGLLGLVLNKTMVAIERKTLHWTGR